MTEAPFMSRDRLRKYQEHFQGIQKHTYMKGRFDKITSVAIPLAFAASCLALIGNGVYNMAHGIGKKE
ncbi:COX VIIa-like protein [Zostera marina]|uniref:COX VIIa-like protein n=1 Tax=Zostera marina TaxID=29655 RepID=A0A0K9PLE9_ZOSMR|nr:COX VIIa-like protein [Zostera marina]